MATTYAFNRIGRRQPDPRWPSAVVSVVVTALLFSSAFLAMRTVSRIADRAPAVFEPPVVLHFEPAVPRPVRVPPVERVRPPAQTPAQQPTTSSANPAAAANPSSVVPSSIAPLPITAPIPRDTATAAAVAPVAAPKSAPAIPLVAQPRWTGMSDTAMTRRPGAAPFAPAGVTNPSRSANTARYRDSVATSVMANVVELARTTPPSAETRGILESTGKNAATLQKRSTSAGNSGEVATHVGAGVNGVGAVGQGVSAGGVNGLGAHGSAAFPLFSSGPSPEQRARDALIDGDNQARLRRLQDRLRLRRDSVRADSLRRDSLARAKVIHPDDLS